MHKIYTLLRSLSFIITISFYSAQQGVFGRTATASDSTIIQYDTLAIITEPKGARIEKDFDKVRDYQSYDPITKTWSAIEDFKEVDILTDTTQQPAEEYLYYSFWAYDPIRKQWKRVNIRNYGYERPDKAASKHKKPRKPFFFWKNFGMSLSTGGGGTYYNSTVQNLNLMVRKGENEYFLQSTSNTDKIQGKAYRIRWFTNTYSKITGIKNDGVVHDEQSFEEIEGKKVQFKGFGFNIPFLLNFHYTFFERLRVGIGSNFTVNYLKSLSVQDLTYTAEKPWFYHIKWFGMAGYKVFRRGLYTVLVDTQLGIAYDLGNEPIKNFTKFINNTFYANLGIAHERRLNDLLSFFYRLSGEWKQFENKDEFNTEGASVRLLQPALYLEAGLTIYFGRQTPLKMKEGEPLATEGGATTQEDGTPITNPTTADEAADVVEATKEKPVGESPQTLL
jgi:hypothetical protein